MNSQKQDSYFFKYYYLILDQLNTIIKSNDSRKTKELRRNVSILKRYKNRYNKVMWSSFQTLAILQSLINDLSENYLGNLNGTASAISKFKDYMLEIASSNVHYELFSKLRECLINIKTYFDYSFEALDDGRAVNKMIYDKVIKKVDDQIKLLESQFCSKSAEIFSFDENAYFFSLASIPELDDSREEYYDDDIWERIVNRYKNLKDSCPSKFESKKKELNSSLFLSYELRKVSFYRCYYDMDSFTRNRIKVSYQSFTNEILKSQTS